MEEQEAAKVECGGSMRSLAPPTHAAKTKLPIGRLLYCSATLHSSQLSEERGFLLMIRQKRGLALFSAAVACHSTPY